MSEEIKSTKEVEPKQEMTSADVVNLYFELDNLGIKIWVDGGWGVDALLGKQTRPHKDLDIAIQQKDIPKLRELLEAQEYKDVKFTSPEAYKGLEPDWEWCDRMIMMYNVKKSVDLAEKLNNNVKSMFKKN